MAVPLLIMFIVRFLSSKYRPTQYPVRSPYSTIGSIDHRMKQIDEYLDSLKANEDNQ